MNYVRCRVPDDFVEEIVNRVDNMLMEDEIVVVTFVLNINLFLRRGARLVELLLNRRRR